MNLLYACVAVCSETKENDMLSEDIIKTWVGMDPIYLRPMYKEAIEVITQAKLLLITNSKPGTTGEQAMIDRTTMIESTARFQVESKMEEGDIKADKMLIDKLLGPELTQVFVFLLKGSMAWYANQAKTGSAEIELPDKVKNTTKEDHDSVSAWIQVRRSELTYTRTMKPGVKDNLKRNYQQVNSFLIQR